MTQYNPRFFPIPLCANRSSTFLFISVCFTGSEEPQQGENVKFHQHMVMFLIKICDGICFIRCFFFPVCASSLQTHRAVPHASISTENESSSQGNRTRRRRRRHHRQTPPSSQPQSPVQHILNPANLLRRLLPSSSLFNSGANAS